MDNLILDKKTGVFRAGNMDFGCGALSGRLVFSESGNTSLATVYADGGYPGGHGYVGRQCPPAQSDLFRRACIRRDGLCPHAGEKAD